jgi:hypothetical protein
MKRRCTLLVGFSVLMMLIVTIIGDTDADALPGPTLSLSVARQAFATTWPGFFSGFDHKNLARVSTYGTPEMTEAVSGYYSCGCTTWVLHGSSVRFSVPIEQQYPLSFLAEVAGRDSKNQPMVEEAVLSKSNPADRWRVAYMVALETANPFLGISSIRAAPPMPFRYHHRRRRTGGLLRFRRQHGGTA